MHVVNPEIGSQWRRWDLHVHTPDSLVNMYRGENPWERFFADLRALPDGYVLGINDYLFVDGYEKVREAHDSGLLPNIAAVFPVVEFRLSNLVGTHGHLNRINAHVVFSNELSTDTIRGQFINGLSSSYKLDHESGLEATWAGIPTLEGLAEFGRAIRASVPEGRQHEYAESDLVLGFNNLVVPLEEIQRRMNDTAFRDKAILAVGKAEWESMDWNDKSVGLKKTVINLGSLVFTAAESLEAYRQGRKRLQSAGINDRLVDCSDAHAFSDSADKDRIGNCLTWMNADPTFEGLLHAITEYEERVYVGSEPPKLRALRDRPDQHISSVTIRRKTGHEDAGHHYFDVSVPLNPGFVAIVGNKGKGKSALLDVIGLATGSRNEPHFTFLSDSRFRSRIQNMARSYETGIQWASGDVDTRGLDSRTSDDEPERATYLPQDLIDTICSADPGEEPARRFTAELGKVLFAHVPEADRLGSTDLESLIAARTNEIERRIRLLRNELSVINEAIATDEERSLPERRKELNGALKLAQQQLIAHQATQPPDAKKPPEIELDPALSALSERLEELKTARGAIEAERDELEVRRAELAVLADDASQLGIALATMERELAAFDNANRPRADRLGLNLDQLLEVRFDRTSLQAKTQELATERSAVRAILEGSDEKSIPARLAATDLQISKSNEQLKGPAEEYAKEIKRADEWAKTHERLAVGTVNAPGVTILQTRLSELDQIPDRLAALREQRRGKVREIHAALLELISVYSELYEPALSFIQTHPLATAAQLEFGVDLQERDLGTLFWEMYGRNVAGSFQGRDAGMKMLDEFVKKTDFTDVDAVVSFVDGIDDAIHYNVRGTERDPVDPFRAIRTGHSLEKLYDLIFGLEYLEPVYALEYSGVPIDRLSPGEKGTLLLMFYLLVDRSARPLLLDQPDENLDNQTIKELLVPAIKEAKTWRQVIVITHNPNVAVVADADQIVAAAFDDGIFRYESGSIESWPINKHVVDVLEGTWPAIANRNEKYQKPRAT